MIEVMSEPLALPLRRSGTLPSRAFVLRATLLAACAVAALGSAVLASPEARFVADPALARLLRGMAALKLLSVFAGCAAFWWRVSHPISPRLALGYSLGLAVCCGAGVWIWQLSQLALAAAGLSAFAAANTNASITCR